MKSFVRSGLHLLKLLTILNVGILCGCVREAGEAAPVVNGWNEAASHSPVYVVKPGDTLYSIAWAFGLDYRNLAFNNQLSPPYSLVPGQKLDMVMRAAPPVTPKSPVVELAPQQDLVVNTNSSAVTSSIKMPPASALSHKPSHITKPLPNGPVHRWLKPARGRIVHGFSRLPFGNKGIDIQGSYGEPVLASAAGQVVYAGAGIRGYGNLIILKHNENYLSAYAYNKTINVKEGAWVRAGQTIGAMGKTDAGIVLLHFEIRRNGTPVNPLIYLKQ